MNEVDSGSGTPPGCVPTEVGMADGGDAGTAVNETCGVFLSVSGHDNDPGTKDDPVQTFAKAFERAKANGTGRVYACAEVFPDAIEVPPGIEIYGGLDCTTKGWPYIGDVTKTTVAPATDLVPVTLLAGEGARRLEDILAMAADATTPGGSSIAVIAQDGAEAELVRCELVAQAGATGAPGAPPKGTGQVGSNGDDGLGSAMACVSTANVPGATEGQLRCAGLDIRGGSGGNGRSLNDGEDGGDGLGTPGVAPMDGKGGAGQINLMMCGDGHEGGPGQAGLSGSGAVGLGDITTAGYTGPTGSPGMTPGTPGQGGGGGGGASKCANNNAGPSGGGGGSGGCGGAPGVGGGAGGSSIGLLSHHATVTLTSVSIRTAAGGSGGPGGDGQPGGIGGDGGLAGQPGSGDTEAVACAGGKGGDGGRGGSGGGGLGGHAIGIASKGAAPIQNEVTFTPGTAGDGGIGGDNDMSAEAKGAQGQVCTTLYFDESGFCTPPG